MTEIGSFSKGDMEIEKNIPTQITEIRKILKEVHNIIVPEKCDNYIARCLRVKDGNVLKAVKLIKALYLFTIEISEWDVKIKPSAYAKNCYNLNLFVPIVTRDFKGRRVFISRVSTWNPKILSLDQIIIACWMLAQFSHAEYIEDQRHGYVIVWDFTGATLEQFWAIKHKRMISMAIKAQHGVMGRIKKLHLINHPRIVDLIYSGLKPFLSEKITKRIKFHCSLESLHKNVDIKHLPTCLGGELSLDDLKDKEFIHGLVNSDTYFQDIVVNQFPSD